MKNISMSFTIKSTKNWILGAVVVLGVSSCTSDKNSPGIEFMPDMYRPQSYEAYLEKYDIDSSDFFEKNIEKISPDFADLDSAGQSEVLKEVQAIYDVWGNGSATRKPAVGSVAKGKKPYPLTKDQKEESKALVNPVAYSKMNLKEGKAYYEIFCDHCHGAKGDGNGTMPKIGVYPAQPTSYVSGAGQTLTAGEIYHTIYHGKGVMGSHASQISEDKRWKIVLYVQSLQGVEFESSVEKGDSAAVTDTIIK